MMSLSHLQLISVVLNGRSGTRRTVHYKLEKFTFGKFLVTRTSYKLSESKNVRGKFVTTSHWNLVTRHSSPAQGELQLTCTRWAVLLSRSVYWICLRMMVWDVGVVFSTCRWLYAWYKVMPFLRMWFVETLLCRQFSCIGNDFFTAQGLLRL